MPHCSSLHYKWLHNRCMLVVYISQCLSYLIPRKHTFSWYFTISFSYVEMAKLISRFTNGCCYIIFLYIHMKSI